MLPAESLDKERLTAYSYRYVRLVAIGSVGISLLARLSVRVRMEQLYRILNDIYTQERAWRSVVELFLLGIDQELICS